MLALPEQGLTVQDRNRVKALTLPMAPTAAELAAVAYRAPVALPEVQGLLSRASIPVVDVDGAAILNRALPLDRLHALYMSAETPTPLRRELLGVVWTRAFVLGRWDILHKLLSDMQKRLPAKAALLQQIDATVDLMEKRARAAVFLLLHPGLVGSLSAEITYADPRQPSELALPNMHRYYLHDGSRENWWCSLPAGRYWQQDPMPEPPPAPAFLSMQEKRRWSAEYRLLTATPNATEYLGALVLEWAKSRPRDATLPDALRMIVRSARGGCVTPDARPVGRQAFQHLHRYFPASEAARLTRSHA